jgi:hypothetical protein
MLWSPGGVSFGGKRTLDHHSSKTVQTSSGKDSDGFSQTSTTSEALAPALTVASRGRFMEWTGTDRRLDIAGLCLCLS